MEEILYGLILIGAIAALIYFARGRPPKAFVLPDDPYELPGPPAIKAEDIPQTLKDRVRVWATERGLDPSLIWGIVQTESGGDPNARNPSDPSAGLMQVTPLIGRAFANLSGTNAQVLDQLLEPDVNLRAGTGFVLHLRNRYSAKFQLGEWVQAYNVGETLFDKGIRNDTYGNRVLKFAATWRG